MRREDFMSDDRWIFVWFGQVSPDQGSLQLIGVTSTGVVEPSPSSNPRAFSCCVLYYSAHNTCIRCSLPSPAESVHSRGEFHEPAKWNVRTELLSESMPNAISNNTLSCHRS